MQAWAALAGGPYKHQGDIHMTRIELFALRQAVAHAARDHLRFLVQMWGRKNVTPDVRRQLQAEAMRAGWRIARIRPAEIGQGTYASMERFYSTGPVGAAWE